MFAKLLSTLAAMVLTAVATAQQMPMPSTNTPAVKGNPTPSAPASTPVKIEAVTAKATTKAEPGRTGAMVIPTGNSVNTSQTTAKETIKPAPTTQTAALSIRQVAEAQRLQLAAETAQKLGLINPAPQTPLPAADFIKPYRAPKQYPKIEYIAGTVGAEKVGFRMPDGELLALEAGNSIQQWRIKQIVNGNVFLEMPPKKNSGKAAKNRKAKNPTSRTMTIGQSLK
ncbi:hypothetical protein [Janthinobacterium sp. Ant5-2-1]|uniref:hypothetical protein n=1 Tax=Janthinobacterium sp. Ant5-2-1 TaxID=1755239 RepID=UPI000AD842CF|nr:hypothetical protein [Janthinobacterium sp. Ant5-2-1]